MEARTLPNRAQMAPRGGQDAQKTEKEDRPNKKEGGAPQGPPILSEKVANMAPSWAPSWSQDGSKLVIKHCQKMMYLGIDFWLDFGGFWVPKSSQVGTKMG